MWHPKAVMQSGRINPVCLALAPLVELDVPG